LATLHWGWLAGAVIFVYAGYYGRALRWAAMIRPYKPDANVWNLFSATAIGFTAVFLLGRAAEFVRPYLISARERVSLSSQLAAWLLERMFDLLTALLIFGFALSQVDHSAAALGPGLEWVLRMGGLITALLGGLALGVIVLFRHFSGAMRRRVLDAISFLPARHHRKAGEIAAAFAQGMEATKDWTTLLLILGYTILEWLLIAGCFVCMIRAFPGLALLTLTDVLILMGFVAFGGVVQIPGIGGGVQLVTIVVLTELFRLPLELASSVALVSWIITYVVITPLGVVFILAEGLNWRKIKEMKEQAAL